MSNALFTFKDLAQAIRNGHKPVVTFTEGIGTLDDVYPEPGMRARVVDVFDGGRGVLKVEFDFSAFEAHNVTMESATWRGSGGKSVTAHEGGFYEPVDSVHVAGSDDVAKYMTFDADASLALFDEFKASGSAASYNQWLEALVLTLRQQLVPAAYAKGDKVFHRDQRRLATVLDNYENPTTGVAGEMRLDVFGNTSITAFEHYDPVAHAAYDDTFVPIKAEWKERYGIEQDVPVRG